MKHTWARPSFFLNVSRPLLPILFVCMVLFFAAGLYTALVTSPPDYQQGEAMRIMYVHVPASWMALFAYGFLALMSLFTLVWRHPLAEILAVSTVPIGALFTCLSLITGSLWGKPMWGAYWVWDARLTSVLILLFLYGGYWALYKSYFRPDQGVRAASLLALVGVINLPIIKWSVEWWNTLHQPSSFTKFSGPSIHPSMLMPLLLMAAAYFCYFWVVLILKAQTELKKRKLLVREAVL
jgi:heme exporter protein C